MHETLVIYLHNDNLAMPHWAIVNELGEVERYKMNNAAENFAGLAHGRQVIVAVPTEDIVLTSVQLPRVKRSKLYDLLPYALEEDLAGNMDELHFSVGDCVDSKTQVAAVNKATMQSWLAILSHWEVIPDAIVPTVFSLPLDEAQILYDEVSLIRTGPQSGFAVDKQNLDIMIGTLSAQGKVTVLSTEEEQPTSQHPFNFIVVPEDVLFRNQIKNLVNTPHINLLQAEFAVKSTSRFEFANMWKWYVAFASVFVGLLVLYPLGSYFILRSKQATLKADVAKIYHEHFPHARAIIAPKQRLQSKLHEIAGATGESFALTLLAKIGRAQAQTSGIHINQFHYRNKKYVVELQAADSDKLSLFTSKLTDIGLSVKQQGATLEGERVKATLEVQ